MPAHDSVFDRLIARAAGVPKRILLRGFDPLAGNAARELLQAALPALAIVETEGAESVDGELLGPGVAPPEREAAAFRLLELRSPTEAGERVLAFADGGVDPAPPRLAAVALAAARQYRRLCEAEPRVALLSFSTHGSARHERVARVREALERLREAAPELVAGGELQGDAALSAAVAAKKAPGDPAAGRANVLVFPDATCGTIALGLVSGLGQARVEGPFLAPGRRPANRVSRGASTEAIVLAAAVTALQAG